MFLEIKNTTVGILCKNNIVQLPGNYFSFPQRALKELEHRKLGWKVLILKYDLGKSLSKEMWCKMADTKKIWLHILKDEKCM